jgi:hypothetical protein
MYGRNSNSDRHGDEHADCIAKSDKYGNCDRDEHGNQHGNEYADRHSESDERPFNNGQSVKCGN